MAFSKYLVRAVSADDVLVTVAEIEGTGLVGFSLAQTETLPAWFGGEQIGLIRYLAVAEDQHGKGIGGEMAVFVIDWSGSKYERLLVLKPFRKKWIVRRQIDRRLSLRIG